MTIGKSMLLDYARSIKYHKFTQTELTNDSIKSERTFSGRLTKGRYKALSQFCRLHSYRIPVQSDYDCTGQLTGHYMTFKYCKNQIVVTLYQTYDL